jgi:hypothetical protein
MYNIQIIKTVVKVCVTTWVHFTLYGRNLNAVWQRLIIFMDPLLLLEL